MVRMNMTMKMTMKMNMTMKVARTKWMMMMMMMMKMKLWTTREILKFRTKSSLKEHLDGKHELIFKI